MVVLEDRTWRAYSRNLEVKIETKKDEELLAVACVKALNE